MKTNENAETGQNQDQESPVSTHPYFKIVHRMLQDPSSDNVQEVLRVTYR